MQLLYFRLKSAKKEIILIFPLTYTLQFLLFINIIKYFTVLSFSARYMFFSAKLAIQNFCYQVYIYNHFTIIIIIYLLRDSFDRQCFDFFLVFLTSLKFNT